MPKFIGKKISEKSFAINSSKSRKANFCRYFAAFFLPFFSAIYGQNLAAQMPKSAPINQTYLNTFPPQVVQDFGNNNLPANRGFPNQEFLKAAEETANMSPSFSDQKISFDSNLNSIKNNPLKARSYISDQPSLSESGNQPAKDQAKIDFQGNNPNSLYNKELYFSESKNSLTLPEFRDIDGRLTPRYSEEKLSIYDPKTPTPSRFYAADLSMPEIFASTNNLAKKTGSFYRAYGEVIFIQGTITDSFSVPIHNAVVEIWQTNAAGKYHSLLEPSSEYIDKFFNMSGRAITDNLGNYYFITVMPGSSAGRAPHINFNIYHPRFGKLESEMYFEKHPYNKTDYQYLSYSEDEQRLITAYASNTDILNPKSIKIFTFNIVMRGIHQFKKF